MATACAQVLGSAWGSTPSTCVAPHMGSFALCAQTSFGSDYPNGFVPTTPAPWYQAEWISTYAIAMQPLANASVLVVAAAGEWLATTVACWAPKTGPVCLGCGLSCLPHFPITGNQNIDLDLLLATGYSYSPCLIQASA